MTRLGLQVRGIGAVTPVGLSAPASFAALRAGIARLGPIETHAVAGPGMESQALIGGRVPLELLEGKPEDFGSDYPGHRAVGARQPPPLPTYVDDGPERLAAMVVAAAEEALVEAGWKADPRTPLEVLVAIDREDDDDATRAALADAIARASSLVGLAPSAVVIEPLGRAGVMALLARRGAGRPGRLLVGGVGSWIRPARAAALGARGKLRSADKPLAPHPGECAAFVALEPGEAGVYVASAACADEATAPPDPTLAQGLSTAIDGALAAAGGPSPRPLVVCDLTGDRARGIEWGLANTRVFGAVHDDVAEVWHPAEGVGDGGAGLGALCLAWAVAALTGHNAGTSRVLVWSASEGPLRAAAVVARAVDDREPASPASPS